MWGRVTDNIVERGEGAYVYDVAGQPFTWISPAVNRRDQHRALPFQGGRGRQRTNGRIIHAQINILYHQPMLKLVEALRTVVPAATGYLFSSPIPARNVVEAR